MELQTQQTNAALRTVLVAVGEDDADRIDELARTAINIAGPAGATVRLAHVFTAEKYDGVRDRLNFPPASEHTADDVAKRHTPIRRLGDALDDAGIQFTWHGRVGDPGESVVELADELDADLVVVGGRRRSPTGKAVFGSISQEVLLNAPCPVTFVRSD